MDPGDPERSRDTHATHGKALLSLRDVPSVFLLSTCAAARIRSKSSSKNQTLLETAPYARAMTEPVAIRSTSCATLLERLFREDVAEPRCNYEWCPSDFVPERALGRPHGETAQAFVTVTQSVSLTDQRWVPLIGQTGPCFLEQRLFCVILIFFSKTHTDRTYCRLCYNRFAQSGSFCLRKNQGGSFFDF